MTLNLSGTSLKQIYDLKCLSKLKTKILFYKPECKEVMSLIQAHKNSLTAQRPDIQSNFLKFRSIRAFMGIYQISAGKVFLTFSNTNNFDANLRVGKANLVKICVFDCSLDFNVQMDACLA